MHLVTTTGLLDGDGVPLFAFPFLCFDLRDERSQVWNVLWDVGEIRQ